MQSIKLLSLQSDLCTPCLTEQRQSEALQKIRQQVGPKYAQCRFESFRETKTTTPVVQALKQYLEGPRGGIFLFGPPGTGKTHLATAMMRALIEQGRDCQYVTLPELFINIKRSFDQSQGSSEEDLLVNDSAPILILDDLGVGSVTEWVCQIIHLILDRRDRHLKPTVLISNLSPERIALLFGDAIASRIAGMCKIMKLEGEDRRLQGPRPKLDSV
ncbi:MAG: ATP-binding protein [Nitrospira sp.]|nr:ATP-binding protein [Nitrospira sp.]